MNSPINSFGANGSLRIHTRTNQPRTSSNKTAQEQFRGGLKSGVDLTNSALKHIGKPIPGSAALSASLSDASRSLASSGGIDASPSLSGSGVDGDVGTLQDEMVRNNQQMLEQQWQVSQITTSYSTRSYILKAMFDALKTIGSNIR